VLPAFPVEAVDTVAAGDALNGGLEAQRAAQRAAQMPALLWNLPHNK